MTDPMSAELPLLSLINSSKSHFPLEVRSYLEISTSSDKSTVILDPMDADSCSQDALTDSFGWFIQGVLACLAFMLLIIKRFCEPKRYRRHWVIWFYDTSKQGFGALVIHFANVFLASTFHGDPCTWYIVSFLLDSSIGLLIIFAGIRTSQLIAKHKGWSAFNFGEYGVPPQVRAWLGQCALYIAIMVLEKILITCIIQLDFWNDVRELILSPIKDPKLKVAVVVLVIPFVINAIMFWVVDNFLMHKHHKTKDEEYGDGAGRRKMHYKKADRREDSESETLLSAEDDDSPDPLNELKCGVHRHHSSSSATLT